VKSLSHFSRANNDEPMAPARLNDICEEALVLCREKVVKSGVEMRVENRSNCLIACHSHQIGQIIVNLVGNACDAVGTSPKKDINLSIYTENDFVKLEVWDSGPGVKDEAKLFRPFHTTKSAGKGTGLGLIISKRLVERHGGKISYKRENEKTCFTVELPLLKSESSKAAA
ncbi:MAG: sensor histidine kinase, partial [Pseudobdellovibrionaceae bacterium]